jgi:hypothetical protein
MLPPLSNDLTTRHGETAPAVGGFTPLSSSFTTRTYSTGWMPLEGTIQDWLDVGREAALATALAAAGHALFALSHEKRALHCYTQGWYDSWREATQPVQDAFQQTEQHLAAAAHHWSHAAHLLDGLTAQQQPEAVPVAELNRIRALARTAREQRARLDKLAEEVRTDLAAARQQKGVIWPSD